jgi:SAM-dependent methyltransferase
MCLTPFMQSDSPPPWHEDPQFWIALRDGIFDPQSWSDASDEVDQLLALTGVAAGANVLDMPCGPGRHVVPLAARGFAVCGVDLNEAYLEEARQLAKRAQLSAELICADMREFVRPDTFDLALSLYTSFGYSEDPADDARILENMRRSLRPSGRLAMELVTRESRVATGSRRYELGNGRSIVEQAELVQDGAVIQRSWQLRWPGGERSWIAWHRLYAIETLIALVERAGFTEVVVYGGLDGRELEPDNHGVVVLARRA